MSLSARQATRGVAETAGWVLPGILLALMPKCPACVAGYIALATGLGVSFTAASYLRSAAIFLSILVLIWLLFTRGRKSLKRLKRASGCQSQASGGGDGGGVACGCDTYVSNNTTKATATSFNHRLHRHRPLLTGTRK